jgi:Putative zinc-finger
MDHSEASRLMASEKYLLDELSPTEMEEFEEHLFGCHDCAMDVRAGSVFLEQGKLELANSEADTQRIAAEVRPSRGFSWWRAAFAIPAMAILLIVVGYQNLVTYPALKGALAENRAPRILPAAALVSSATRGAEPSVIRVNTGEPFLLPVDIAAQTPYQSYVINLQNPSGGVQWSLPVSSELVKNTLTIAAPGVNTAGHYEVVVLGRSANGETSEVGRYPFELQFARAANP